MKKAVGNTVLQFVKTNCQRWCPKRVSQLKFQVITQTTACEQLERLNCTQLGVPEKIIQECADHHPVECLCMYKHTSDKQQHAVSNILSSSSELNYQSEMRKLKMGKTHTTIPNMTFNNCQVSINYNQGLSAPTYSSHCSTYMTLRLSIERITVIFSIL